MRGFWGLMRAYWISERWKEAWALTIVIALFTAASSKTGVWLAEASGELINSIAFFHSPDNPSPLATVLTNAAFLIGLVIFKDAGIIGVRHLFSTTLHRKWRGWLDSRFNAALLDDNHTHYHLQHASGDTPPPDNVEQRVQESIKGMTGGAIGLAMGVLGVVTSLYFVGEKLLQTSTVVNGLEFLGTYGGVTLAFAAVAVYVPLNTYLALKLGRMLQNLNNAIQQAEGSYRGELTTFLRRSFHIAAARGESVQRAINARLYKDINGTWSRLNVFNAGYMSFEKVYDFFGARIVAYGPGLIPYMHQQINLKGYVTGAELVNSLISQCSWFIHVMPEIATLRTNAKRVTELAEAIENVQRPSDFYALSGRSDFRYGGQNAIFGLTVSNLELTHQGADAAPFLKVERLRFKRGEWVFVKGDSGSGKTSLLKAINGLWPYGTGDIVRPEGVRTFYAAQEVKLPQVTLKELVCIPFAPGDYTDARVAAALHHAGLGEFIEFLDLDTREGKTWEQVLSGGQKQKLVLARIVLQKPGLLFLDEACGALDQTARIAFHQALKDHCEGTTVISVMHEAMPPRAHTGEQFYDSIVSIADGVATKSAVMPLPSEITTILAQANEPVRRLRGIPRLRVKQK